MNILRLIETIRDEWLLDSAVRSWFAGLHCESDCLCYTKLTLREGVGGFRRMKPVCVIVCTPDAFYDSYASACAYGETGEVDSWIPYFTSSAIQVWLRSDVVSGIGLVSILEDKQIDLLTLARSLLKESIQSQRTADMNDTSHIQGIRDALSKPNALFTSIDVVLWCDGELRGSYVSSGATLLHALRQAVIGASHDERFRPLSVDEVERTRIEVHVIGSLHIPLTRAEYREGWIESNKTYALISSGREATFVPSVWNCRLFQSLDEFLAVLRYEKVGVPTRVSDERVFVRETISWIEGVNRDEPVLFLSGTYPIKRDESIHIVKRREALRGGVEFLLAQQFPDGSFCTFLSPFSPAKPTIDWIRNAHCVFALATVWGEYHESEERKQLRDALERGYHFLMHQIRTHRGLSHTIRCASLLYLYEAARILHDREEELRIHDDIARLAPLCPYDPILYTNLSLHIETYVGSTSREYSIFQTYGKRVLDDFHTKKQKGLPIEFAKYIDIVRAKWLDERTADEVLQWLLSFQYRSGGFSIHTQSRVRSTRTTAKILETLARRRCLEESIEFRRGMQWVESLQYRPEADYFIPHERRPRFYGGFRDNEQSPLVRADTVSHYIISRVYVK